MAPGASPDPSGPSAAFVPLRRLTREQYANTVRDLLGLEDDVSADLLPNDEAAAGFRSNIVAPVAELHVERYQVAAELLAGKAVASLPALLACDPVKAGEPACAGHFIETFGRRAYRRPLAAAEILRFKTLYQAARERGTFATGIRLVVEAFLQSVHFLYRFEPPAPAAGPGLALLPPHALASRLSYFLWNTMPDDALVKAADAGQLSTPDQIGAATARMTADSRFDEALVSFHTQWLDVNDLANTEKKATVYPAWNSTLKASMREEMARFVTYVVRTGDGRLDTLLNARYSVVGGPLLELYGLGKAAAGAPIIWQKRELDPTKRAGILTEAAVMAAHAHTDQPSLVHRGRLIRERLFCQLLPPPPPNVNNTLPAFDPKQSSRLRFEQHRSDPACAGCHRLIDPLGAPFEIYDGIGGHRTMDGPRPVDALGEIIGTARSDGPVKNAVELADRLAVSEDVRECLAQQWLRYAHGRQESASEAGSLRAANRAFRDGGHRVVDLVSALTRSDAFRYQEVTP